MAEIVTGPFVSFVVERLGHVLIQEGSVLRGISGQVEQMQTELTRMKYFLKDAAAKREEGDESVRNWIAEIREAAYDAEDVIDTYIIKVSFRRGTGILNVLMRYSSCVFKDSIAIHKVGVKIESIKTKISSIRASLEAYGIKATSEEESSSSRHERERLQRQSYPHIMEDDIVGLDEDLKMIVEHLVREKIQCQVVSIWGMGGLGKTTLAKKVYHHNDVRRHFDFFAWAFISQQCKTREVLEGILVELTSPSFEDMKKFKMMSDPELVAELCRVQSQKKCLVVVDDIWKVEDWKILSPAFPNEKVTGSKILLTTRIKEVASNADQQHKLKYLNEIESWDLFEKKAILKRNNPEFELSTKMMELGKEMVKHCGGLPLAIVVLGGLLATKHKMDEWEMVSRNIGDHLNKGGAHPVLALSYQDLPYHLKACFLYLSHFPEDYDIDAETLVQMWMAEGFVSSFDVGMSYLSELAQRCMVQIQLLEFTNTIEFCRLHNLMRELCLSKAQEENFLMVGRDEASDHQFKWENSASSSSLSLTTIRRLAMHYFGDHIAAHNGLEITNHQHLWSCQFYFLGHKLESSGWEQIKSLLKGLKLLRILNLESSTLRYTENKVLPSEIGDLFHLRYLGIRGSRIESLPSSIGNLRFLQTLNLRTDVETRIPNVLWRLEQLRHLYLPYTIKLPGTSKLRLDGLSKLETLENFETKYCDVRCFPKLTNLLNVTVGCVALENLAVILKSPIFNNSNSLLRSLSIYIKGDFLTEEEQSLLRQLLECHHLHYLFLDGFLNLVKLSGQFHPNLTKLALRNTNLEEDPMPTLEKLPNLRRLDMFQNSYIGKEMVCSAPTTTTPTTAPSSSISFGGRNYGCDGGFPQLKYLQLFGIENLEEWRVEEGAMPTLFHLGIKRCPKLKEIPDGLMFITTLQELEIGEGSKVLGCRVQVEGEDFYKIQHVPLIKIERAFDLPTFTSENEERTWMRKEFRLSAQDKPEPELAQFPAKEKHAEEIMKAAQLSEKLHGKEADAMSTPFISELLPIIKDEMKSKSKIEEIEELPLQENEERTINAAGWMKRKSRLSAQDKAEPELAQFPGMSTLQANLISREIAQTEVMPEQGNEAKATDVTGSEELAASLSVKHEAEHKTECEIVEVPVTKSALAAEWTSPSSIKTEVEPKMIPPSTAEILAVEEPKIASFSSETERTLPFSRTESLFTIPSETKGLPILETGAEITASGTEREHHLEPELNVGPTISIIASVKGGWAQFFNLQSLNFHGGHSTKMHDVIKDPGFEELFVEDDYLVFVRTKEKIEKLPKPELDQGKISDGEGLSSGLLDRPKSPNTKDFILLEAGERLTELPPEEKWGQLSVIALMKSEFSSLPEKPSWPNLEFFFVQNDRYLRTISDSFFDHMPSLQVVDLSKTGVRSLPTSLFKLTRLHALLLRDCSNLDELPPEVGNLEHIEVLDLSGTEVYNLPDEIAKLYCLRSLPVSFYGAYDDSEYLSLPPVLISSGIMSKLLSLRALSIVVDPMDWRWNNNAKAITQDVSNLSELIFLQFYFPEVELLELFIQKSLSWEKGHLGKFKFVIGQDIKRIVSRVPDDVESEYGKHDRCLRFVNGNGILKEVAGVLERVTAFYLDHHCVIKSLSEFGISNFKELKFCVVRECPNIVEIIDSKERSDSVLPCLQHLSMHYLWRLENIWKGPVPHGSFGKLKFLSVYTCPKLEFILNWSMLYCLSNMEELIVEDCSSVRVIIEMEGQTINNGAILPHLKRVILHYLPQLVSLWNGPNEVWSMSEPICIYGCPQLKISQTIHGILPTEKECAAQSSAHLMSTCDDFRRVKCWHLDFVDGSEKYFKNEFPAH